MSERLDKKEALNLLQNASLYELGEMAYNHFNILF